jgi:carbon storage regulator
MLILTRKPTQKIRINDDIVITVIKTHHGSVKIGIEAPLNVRILRAEVADLRQPDMVLSNLLQP